MRVPRATSAPKKYKYPHEVFSEVDKLESFHDRVAYLRENASFAVKTILQCNFAPTIGLDLPEGSPPYRKDVMPADLTPARIDKAIKVLGKIAIFPGQAPAKGLEGMKKQTLFINLLESINEDDAEAILLMKEKQLTTKYPTIDETLVKTAFPELFQ